MEAGEFFRVRPVRVGTPVRTSPEMARIAEDGRICVLELELEGL